MALDIKPDQTVRVMLGDEVIMEGKASEFTVKNYDPNTRCGECDCTDGCEDV